jgi:hypothetical protein
MKKFITGSAVLTILIGLAVILYDQPIFHQSGESTTSAKQETAPEPVKPVVNYPVPQPVPIEEGVAQPDPKDSPPALDKKNETLQELLSPVLKEQELASLLHMKNFIQRFVVTIDSLPEKRISPHHLPTKPPQGKFLVASGSISPQNQERYTPYLLLAETLGIEQAVSIYVEHYTLFQQAYRELGYPDGQFNDRFVGVIDHLLETPKVEEPIGVLQSLITYKFSDPALEELSAGQKILLRIGSENRSKAMSILRELRQRLTTLGKGKEN